MFDWGYASSYNKQSQARTLKLDQKGIDLPNKEYQLRVNNNLWISSTSSLSDKMKEIVDDKVLNHIKLDPYNSEYLRMELEGLRSYNELKTDSRIIFAICEECRKNGFQTANNCLDCNKMLDNTIMLFAFGGHDLYDSLGRKRSKAVEKARKLRLRRRH